MIIIKIETVFRFLKADVFFLSYGNLSINKTETVFRFLKADVFFFYFLNRFFFLILTTEELFVLAVLLILQHVDQNSFSVNLITPIILDEVDIL